MSEHSVEIGEGATRPACMSAANLENCATLHAAEFATHPNAADITKLYETLADQYPPEEEAP